MIKTRQKTRKQISNLSLDIEIVNPIESKSLFGGCDYSWHYSDCSCSQSSYSSSYNNMGWTFPTFSNPYSGSTDNSWGTSGNDNSNTYDQNNNGVPDYEEASFVDNNGDGINDADLQQIYDAYPGDLTAPEALWLYMHPTFVTAMYNNQQLAFSLAPGHNGVSDALRHALWSALDAFDIVQKMHMNFIRCMKQHIMILTTLIEM